MKALPQFHLFEAGSRWADERYGRMMVKFAGEDEAADDDTSCRLQFINLNILFLDIFVTYCLPY